jgi:hypothetical protein
MALEVILNVTSYRFGIQEVDSVTHAAHVFHEIIRSIIFPDVPEPGEGVVELV